MNTPQKEVTFTKDNNPVTNKYAEKQPELKIKETIK
jgi:hypothetical protein